MAKFDWGNFGLGAGLGGGVGGLLGGFGKNIMGAFESQAPQFAQFDPYSQIRPLLKQTAQQGYPEIFEESYWGPAWQKTSQDIREGFQARKGFQPGATPETAALGQAQAGLMSNLMQQNLAARQGALGMFARTPLQMQAWQPQTAEQNIMAFLGPILAAGAGGLRSGAGFGVV